MYYVIAKNSENKKTYVSTFKEKREAVQILLFDSKRIKQSEFKQA